MDFHPSHQAAIMIAGTVALPAPFPACGSLSIVVAPEDGDLETYIRIVQVVTGKRIITRFVRLADVRAIRSPADGQAQASPETWPIIGPKEVQRRISTKEKDLRATAAKSGCAGESEWLPAAIVYVPEAAPVLHRNDVAVTAAVSAEEIAFSDMHALSTSHPEAIIGCAAKPAALAAGGKGSWCPGR